MEPAVTSLVRGFLFMKMNGTPRYTVIMHDVREKYKMSLTEYAIADSIYHLQNNEKHICTASREYLGKFVGVTERQVRRIIIDLETKGLVKKMGSNLIVTDEWTKNYLEKEDIMSAQPDKVSSQKRTKCPVKEDIMSTNNNLYIHNKNNISKKEYAPSVKMTEEQKNKLIHDYGASITDKAIEELSIYKESSGKKYKSDYHTILKWVIKEVAGKDRNTIIVERQNEREQQARQGKIEGDIKSGKLEQRLTPEETKQFIKSIPKY